jgi:hypothetical protein
MSKMSLESESEFLATDEAAQLLKTTPGSLAVGRCQRRDGPPFYKIGRKVLYRKSDLLSWVESHRVDPAHA